MLALSIIACISAAFLVLVVLRRRRASLGLPFAFVALLLVDHVPGAWSEMLSDQSARSAAVATGISIAALGVWAFLAGTWVAQTYPSNTARGSRRQPKSVSIRDLKVPMAFLLFCLLGGWLFTFGLRAVVDIPSVNAIIERGGGIWMLGVTIGLGQAVRNGSGRQIILWSSALIVYPLFILVVGGFLGWGSIAIAIVASLLTVLLKRIVPVILGIFIGTILGLSLFVNYFGIRDELRAASWGGAPIEQRAAIASKIFTKFELISAQNPAHLAAVGERLNQNQFLGVAAERLVSGQVNYLWGRSLWEGVISLVPRVFWPEKPVFGGSGRIVPEMTGIQLSETTAWGVGSIMEFYVNFGRAGVLGGLLLLGWIIGKLDRAAAENLLTSRYGASLVYFLPCLALIQPLGSIVELTSGAAAAYLAAVGWRFLWLGKRIERSDGRQGIRPGSQATGMQAAARFRDTIRQDLDGATGYYNSAKRPG